MTGYFLQMALNNAWANATLHRACAGLTEAEFRAPRPGFFGSLCRTLNHIYEVDLFYMDALRGGGLGRAVYRREDIGDPRVLAAKQAETDLALAAFCGALSPEVLAGSRVTARREGEVREVRDVDGGVNIHVLNIHVR